MTRFACIRSPLLLTITVFLLIPLDATAQDVKVTAFVPPLIVKTTAPSYPQRPLQLAEEGSVEVNFMVDTEGKPFDFIVTSTMGDKSFENATSRAIAKFKFEPARLDGEPIVGSSSYRIMFKLEDNAGASTRFIRLYRQHIEALEAEDQALSTTRLAELESSVRGNFYEYAFLNLARFSQALKYGDQMEQMTYLHAALSNADSPEDQIYFPDEETSQMLATLIQLQLRNKYYPEALDSYALLQKYGGDEAAAVFTTVINAVKALEYDESEYSIPVQLDEFGRRWLNFLKHHVYFSGGNGKLTEITLHCASHYIAFTIERDVSYHLPEAWGDCSGYVTGDSNATALMYQH